MNVYIYSILSFYKHVTCSVVSNKHLLCVLTCGCAVHTSNINHCSSVPASFMSYLLPFSWCIDIKLRNGFLLSDIRHVFTYSHKSSDCGDYQHYSTLFSVSNENEITGNVHLRHFNRCSLCGNAWFFTFGDTYTKCLHYFGSYLHVWHFNTHISIGVRLSIESIVLFFLFLSIYVCGIHNLCKYMKVYMKWKRAWEHPFVVEIID